MLIILHVVDQQHRSVDEPVGSPREMENCLGACSNPLARLAKQVIIVLVDLQAKPCGLVRQSFDPFSTGDVSWLAAGVSRTPSPT